MEVATVVDGSLLKGKRYSVTGADGVPIGLLTSGVGDGLLLVHGGMSQIEAWEPVWDLLSERWQATAMDRRGLRDQPGV
jgi:pimeloyl-ACP methyl ester carboxylesterase